MKQFTTPFQAVLSGPSGCGKTTFVCNLINRSAELCDKPFDKIIWCHSEVNAQPKNLKVPTKFVLGIPETFENPQNENICIVIDDLMGNDDKRVAELFTRGCHHRNLSVCYLLQNLFNKSAHSRSISLNSKYFVLFKNPRDVGQIGHFARQLCPDSYSDFVKLFKEITQNPHSYLVIDCSQEVPDLLRFRTNIFFNDDYSVVLCEQPNENTQVNGKKVEFMSVGEEQAFALCPTGWKD